MSEEIIINDHLIQTGYVDFVQNLAMSLISQPENPLEYLSLKQKIEFTEETQFFLLLHKLPYFDLEIDYNEVNKQKLQRIYSLIQSLKYLDKESWQIIVQQIGFKWSGNGGLSGLAKELFLQDY